jgi:hypothetical protein
MLLVVAAAAAVPAPAAAAVMTGKASLYTARLLQKEGGNLPHVPHVYIWRLIMG